MSEKNSCPVCEATVCSPFKKKNRFDSVQSFSPSSSDFGIFFDLYKCQGCGAVYSLEYPNYEDIESFYLNSDHDGYLSESKNRQATFKRIIKLIDGYLGPKKDLISLMDIGASAGLFLHTVQIYQPAWSISGIEASRQAVNACKSRFNIDLIHGMLEDISLESHLERYDVITMFDIIEHVRQPLKMMQKASEVMLGEG